MDKMYVHDMVSDILALLNGEDIEGAKAICRNEMQKIEEESSATTKVS